MSEAPKFQTAPPKGPIVPYLQVESALEAVRFYKKAFGAEEAAIMPADSKGRIMHAHIYVFGGSVMLSDPFPDHGHPYRPAQGITLTLMVKDIDQAFGRAVEAGCEALMKPQDMFWGDRYGQLKDPFGITWAMNQGKD